MFINDNKKKEIKEIALYYIEVKRATLRSASEIFNVPKSTIHYMFRRQLELVDVDLYKKVMKKADFNIKERPIRAFIYRKLKEKANL